MDVVITYVDGNDPHWRTDYAKYSDAPVQEKRFRDWGTLKYLLRGIEKHMHFVQNVFLVVSHESQVPQWVDKNVVRVVLHKDFIPQELLPTFNCNPIEMHLHNIEGLGEEYIYFNDDLFPVAESKPEDFYREGKGVLGFSRHLFACGMFKQICRNSDIKARGLLSMPDSLCFLRPQHSCQPMFKSICSKVYGELKEDILTSMTRTRTASNMNQYLYLDYAFYSGRMISERISCKHFSAAVTSPSRLRRFIRKPYRKFLCINDVRLGEQKFNQMQSAVIKAFEERFPQKSRFEL
jgi:hypothetical protein